MSDNSNDDVQIIPKVTTVYDLAKFTKTQTVYLVRLHACGPHPISSEDSGILWSDEVHPKIPYERGMMPGVWRSRKAVPKLDASDFNLIIDLLTSKLKVEAVTIREIIRCRHTGEFQYLLYDDTLWPENCLFETYNLACKERKRIFNMVKIWTEQPTDDQLQWNG